MLDYLTSINLLSCLSPFIICRFTSSTFLNNFFSYSILPSSFIVLHAAFCSRLVNHFWLIRAIQLFLYAALWWLEGIAFTLRNLTTIWTFIIQSSILISWFRLLGIRIQMNSICILFHTSSKITLLQSSLFLYSWAISSLNWTSS